MKPDTRTASLPLPGIDEPVTERDAFALSRELQRHYTYEQAMAAPAIRIALRNTAVAMNKARGAHLSAAHGAAHSADICTHV